MSLEKIGNSPFTNIGYFDVPICDDYSNPNQPRVIKTSDQYDLNNTIMNTVNNNKEEYIVTQYPVRPEASLYYQSNVSNSYYDKNYVNKYYNVEDFSNREMTDNKKNNFFFILLVLLILGFILFCYK